MSGAHGGQTRDTSGKQEGGTRDKILEVALRLFARDGYEATSTAAIASEVGITKGALYRHFSDKRAIFDSLVDDMLERHRDAGSGFGLAVGSAEDAARVYAAAQPEQMADLGVVLFRHWTTDDAPRSFRRMLSNERFHDEQTAQVYDTLYVGGQLRYHESVFTRMVEMGAFMPGDPLQMALEFWSPIYVLMQAVDGGMGLDEATSAVRAHIFAFSKAHVRR